MNIDFWCIQPLVVVMVAAIGSVLAQTLGLLYGAHRTKRDE